MGRKPNKKKGTQYLRRFTNLKEPICTISDLFLADILA